jgi:hypothetical protein
MEHMRRIAFETVMRACGFGSLAIFCIMIGLSFEPRISFETGGVLTLLMAGILAFKAHEALTKPYRRTELWLYLPTELRPPAASAQQATSTVLRETYLMFAHRAAAIAVCMLVLALFCSLLGYEASARSMLKSIPRAMSLPLGGSPRIMRGRRPPSRPRMNKCSSIDDRFYAALNARRRQSMISCGLWTPLSAPSSARSC